MKKLVMTGKWLKDQKRWSTVVTLPAQGANARDPQGRKQPKAKGNRTPVISLKNAAR